MRPCLGTPIILAMSLLVLSGCNTLFPGDTTQSPVIDIVLTGLDNLRGIVVSQAGELFVTEAETAGMPYSRLQWADEDCWGDHPHHKLLEW